MEWKDIPNEDLQRWYDIWEKLYYYPVGEFVCPTCGNSKLRYYFWRHRDEDELDAKGGGWLWCPACRTFDHASVVVPAWWKDVVEPAFEEVGPEPDVLDANWELIESRQSA